MDGFVFVILIFAVALIPIAVSVCFFIRKNRRGVVEQTMTVEPAEIVPIIVPQEPIQPFADMLALAEKIEIANRSGHSGAFRLS